MLNLNLRGINFLKKLPTHPFGPQIAGRFEKKRVCQSAENEAIWNFQTMFYPNLKGEQFDEKIAIEIIWGSILPAVLKNRWSANISKMDQFEIFWIIYVKNPNWKGVSLVEKLSTLVFWAPYCGPYWTYWGSVNCRAADPPNMVQSKIIIILNLKSKISVGHFYASWYGPKLA